MKLQGDERLIAIARGGNAGAFETIVDRYQGRLLGFCRQMLGSTEDAEDVLQEVFVNAYRAMLADDRAINLRPWLYRIARNRCLNHLRKPTADAQESMDMVPAVEASSTAEKASNREEFRQLLTDVGKLPETQRTALLLREMDAMSYEEIATAMETSVPSVKSLLVRARISLAEASQARQLTCGEVRLELAEAAEGLRKVTGPIRRHVRDCEECADFRSQVRSNDKVMAALFPAGPLLALKAFLVSKLGFGGAGAGAGAGASGSGAAAGAGAGSAATAAAGTGAVGAGATAAGAVGTAAAISGGSAAGGIGAVGGAVGSKAVAGVVTAAAIAAGAAEVKDTVVPPTPAPKVSSVTDRQPVAISKAHAAPAVEPPAPVVEPAPVAQVPPPAPAPAPKPVPAAPPVAEDNTAGPSATLEEEEGEPTEKSGQHDSKPPKAPSPGVTGAKATGGTAGAPSGSQTVVVTVGGSPSSSSPPAESTPPAESSSPPPADPPAESSSPPPADSTPPAESSSPPPAESSAPPQAESTPPASGSAESGTSSSDPAR